MLLVIRLIWGAPITPALPGFLCSRLLPLPSRVTPGMPDGLAAAPAEGGCDEAMAVSREVCGVSLGMDPSLDGCRFLPTMDFPVRNTAFAFDGQRKKITYTHTGAGRTLGCLLSGRGALDQTTRPSQTDESKEHGHHETRPYSTRGNHGKEDKEEEETKQERRKKEKTPEALFIEKPPSTSITNMTSSFHCFLLLLLIPICCGLGHRTLRISSSREG